MSNNCQTRLAAYGAIPVFGVTHEDIADYNQHARSYEQLHLHLGSVELSPAQCKIGDRLVGLLLSDDRAEP